MTPPSRPHPALLLALLVCWALVVCWTAGARIADGGPPDAAPASDGPLSFEAPRDASGAMHDFGVVEQNGEYAAEVIFRNTGSTRIDGIHVKTDCGCYAASVSARQLAPGETGTLSVRFRTLTFSGPIQKTIALAYEADGPRQARLTLKLNVAGGVVVTPGRLHFGEILAGTAPEGAVAVVWNEGLGRPFEILSVDVGGQPIETRVEPFADPARPAWKGWRVHFRFTEAPALGVYSKRATVRTTHPDQRRVAIPLTAHVVGKVWIQTHRLYLGLVPKGERRSAWVQFRPFSKDIALGTVSAKARGGVLETAIEPHFGPGGPSQKLRVTVPATAPAGALDDVVELRTEVPGEEVTLIEVRGRVFAPADGGR